MAKPIDRSSTAPFDPSSRAKTKQVPKPKAPTSKEQSLDPNRVTAEPLEQKDTTDKTKAFIDRMSRPKTFTPKASSSRSSSLTRQHKAPSNKPRSHTPSSRNPQQKKPDPKPIVLHRKTPSDGGASQVSVVSTSSNFSLVSSPPVLSGGGKKALSPPDAYATASQVSSDYDPTASLSPPAPKTLLPSVQPTPTPPSVVKLPPKPVSLLIPVFNSSDDTASLSSTVSTKSSHASRRRPHHKVDPSEYERKEPEEDVITADPETLKKIPAFQKLSLEVFQELQRTLAETLSPQSYVPLPSKKTQPVSITLSSKTTPQTLLDNTSPKLTLENSEITDDQLELILEKRSDITAVTFSYCTHICLTKPSLISKVRLFEIIKIRHCPKITKESLKGLMQSPLANIKEVLVANDTECVDDSMLSSFEGSQTLEFFGTNSKAITDEGLLSFVNCSKLKTLHLKDSKISLKGIETFNTKRPTNLTAVDIIYPLAAPFLDFIEHSEQQPPSPRYVSPLPLLPFNPTEEALPPATTARSPISPSSPYTSSVLHASPAELLSPVLFEVVTLPLSTSSSSVAISDSPSIKETFSSSAVFTLEPHYQRYLTDEVIYSSSLDLRKLPICFLEGFQALAEKEYPATSVNFSENRKTFISQKYREKLKEYGIEFLEISTEKDWTLADIYIQLVSHLIPLQDRHIPFHFLKKFTEEAEQNYPDSTENYKTNRIEAISQMYNKMLQKCGIHFIKVSKETEWRLADLYLQAFYNLQALVKPLVTALQEVGFYQKKDPPHTFSDFLKEDYEINISKVRKLNLDGLMLTFVPKLIQEGAWPNLEIVELSHNRLSYLAPDTFWRCLKLRTLILSYNDFTSLPTPTSEDSLKTVKELDISHNQLAECPRGFMQNCNQVERLNLSHNLLPEVSPSFLSYRPFLKTVDFSHNHMSKLPVSLDQFWTNVEDMNFSHNRIEAIPNYLKNLNTLIRIDLSYNQIQEIPLTALGFCPSFVSLNLSHNKLATLPPNMGTCWAFLKIIDISHNQIRKIPKDYFETFNDLSSLDIRYNFLTEENMTDLVARFAKYQLSRPHATSIKCIYDPQSPAS